MERSSSKASCSSGSKKPTVKPEEVSSDLKSRHLVTIEEWMYADNVV
jgi:hypothetical protein